jgi:hypothetical protein
MRRRGTMSRTLAIALAACAALAAPTTAEVRLERNFPAGSAGMSTKIVVPIDPRMWLADFIGCPASGFTTREERTWRGVHQGCKLPPVADRVEIGHLPRCHSGNGKLGGPG